MAQLPSVLREGRLAESVFAEEERMRLTPLPAERYEMCEWRSAKVAPDYHVTVDYMHYSVDHALIGEQVDVKLTSSEVSIGTVNNLAQIASSPSSPSA